MVTLSDPAPFILQVKTRAGDGLPPAPLSTILGNSPFAGFPALRQKNAKTATLICR